MKKMYFIAIYPPQKIIEEIKIFKQDFALNFDNSKALKNEAHITLFPPFSREVTLENDILEAFQVGGAAVKAADEGDTGEMVIIKRLSDDPYQSTTDLRNVHKVSNVEKVVPREWITEDGTYVTDEFISYVRPLIQGDVSPVMVDGIPRYLYHKKK